MFLLTRFFSLTPKKVLNFFLYLIFTGQLRTIGGRVSGRQWRSVDLPLGGERHVGRGRQLGNRLRGPSVPGGLHEGRPLPQVDLQQDAALAERRGHETAGRKQEGQRPVLPQVQKLENASSH